MTENHDLRTALVLSQGDDAATDAVLRTLEHDGWRVIRTAQITDPGCTVHGVVYLPGLLSSGGYPQKVEPAVSLVELMEAVQPRLAHRLEGGARVVAVGSRDWLGWPSRPLVAAQSAALVATVRSLALAHGQAGVTVNAVIGLLVDAAERRDIGPARDTHLYEPVPLTGAPVAAEDIAASVAFFLDDRSGYITGQILHCCGGASLLSSLSA
ncbi:SDR family oxidoreductase [Mycolicibacterium goodii]|uniref:SDR family oxidoreductase n=1 Tax=Mycolicibacterium goodii TaxID=134601 RepID=UPI0006730D1D